MRSVLVYRDVILPRSEVGFMRRQYGGFRTLRPVWVGRRLTGDADALGMEALRLGRGGLPGAFDRLAFKGLGLVPPVPDLRALDPAVVHAQFGRGGAFALPLARHLGVPLVVTFHGGDAHKNTHYARRFPPRLYQHRLDALIAATARFVCVSDSVRDRLIERGFPPGKLAVLPIGIDRADAICAPADPPLLLFVGRFVEKKGLAVLIEALHRLGERAAPMEVVIIGDGPLGPALRRQAAGLPRLRFLGWQPAGAVSGWMARAAMLCVPSLRARDGDAEGLPSVAVEAMALGLPVIAGSAAGLAGVVDPGRTGLVVPSGDAAALADAILALRDDPDARRWMGQAGRARVQRDFDAAVQSRRLEALLLEVAGEAVR